MDSAEFLTGQRKFEQGKAVFYINYPVTQAALALQAPDIKYIIAPAPVSTGKDPVVIGRNWAYVVNAKSKNLEEAWKWVQYITNKEAQIRWFQLGGDVPSLIELMDYSPMITGDNSKVVMDSIKNAQPVQQIGRAETNRIQYEMWDRIVLKGEPVENVVKDGAKQETEVIQNILECK